MKIREIIILLIFWVIIINCFGQVDKQQIQIDSLKAELIESTEIKQVDLLNQISKKYENINPDSSFYYADNAEILATQLNYVNGRALANLNKGNYYVRISNFQKAIAEYETAITYYQEDNDKSGLLNVYYSKGKVLRMSGDYDEALLNFMESLKISEEVGDKKGIAYAYLNIGIIYSIGLSEVQGDGLPYFLEALEISRGINDQKCIAYSLNNIALVYLDLNEYDMALEYHHQSLELKQTMGDKAV